mgnify:CR=1 FL=1
MEIYFAPMEGLTDSVYRRAHHKYFPGVDKYYMPFLSPTVHRSLTEREARELPYADTEGFTAVPQLLTKKAEDFLWAAQQCADRGYKEVNLNLGCPSGTVFSKGKGSGFLTHPEELKRFLDEIFEACIAEHEKYLLDMVMSAKNGRWYNGCPIIQRFFEKCKKKGLFQGEKFNFFVNFFAGFCEKDGSGPHGASAP